MSIKPPSSLSADHQAVFARSDAAQQRLAQCFLILAKGSKNQTDAERAEIKAAKAEADAANREMQRITRELKQQGKTAT